MKNNRIVVDLNKCQYAWFSWTTANGTYKRWLKPNGPTVHGQEFDCNAPIFGSTDFKTMLQAAIELKILDTWIPCITLQVSANHRLTYTGDKAISLWKAWCEKQFNKKKKK